MRVRTAIGNLEQWRQVGQDIDQLQEALVKLSAYPVATEAILAALSERYNAREVSLQQLIDAEKKGDKHDGTSSAQFCAQ